MFARLKVLLRFRGLTGIWGLSWSKKVYGDSGLSGESGHGVRGALSLRFQACRIVVWSVK